MQALDSCGRNLMFDLHDHLFQNSMFLNFITELENVIWASIL